MATLVVKHETEVTDDYMAARVRQRGQGVFHSLETRDRVAAKLKSDGLTVSKSSNRNQQLHPEYIVDFVGSYYTGFGNTDYQTYWSRIYLLTVR